MSEIEDFVETFFFFCKPFAWYIYYSHVLQTKASFFVLARCLFLLSDRHRHPRCQSYHHRLPPPDNSPGVYYMLWRAVVCCCVAMDESQEDMFFGALVSLVRNGLTDEDPALKGAYLNSYQVGG